MSIQFSDIQQISERNNKVSNKKRATLSAYTALPTDTE